MALAPGTRLGPYEILSPLGAGGMGEVYRARDSKLNRDVALKILPDAFATDPDRLARFQREAQVLASLNHPNIGHIYGFEDSGASHALVLELVEGPTLADRIARGPIPLADALPIAKQIAEALEAAHEQGIIHRDLKPANVKVRDDGTVKVLDFGLAKALEPTSASGANAANSPTITNAATQTGVILGTAAYMAPEQAKGQAVDKRADIWAFGVVLYEMLAGRRPFTGDSVSELLAAVIKDAPDWSRLPADLPAPVRRLLRRCVEKDLRRRLRSIGDARLELDEREDAHAPISSALGRRRTIGWVLGSAAAIALMMTAVFLVVFSTSRRSSTSPVRRLSMILPDDLTVQTSRSGSVISPDGHLFAFIGGGQPDLSTRRIWLRAIDATTARPLAGTDGADILFWSPDSRALAFFANGKLKRIAADGGDPAVLCGAPVGRGGAWGAADAVVFALSTGPLLQVSANGGEPKAATTLDVTRGETAHRFPAFLPDGRHFLFSVLPVRDGKYDIYAGSVDAPTRQLLVSAESGATYAEPGYLLFGKDQRVVAVRFDPSRMLLSGEAMPLGDPAGDLQSNYLGGPVVSASRTGVLAYLAQPFVATKLAWFDWSGKEIRAIPGPPGLVTLEALSRDDKRAVLTRTTPDGESDTWILDLEQGGLTRFASGSATYSNFVWSPDGSQLAFRNDRSGTQDLLVKFASEATAAAVPLLRNAFFKTPTDWSLDGGYLVYSQLGEKTGSDIWILPLKGERTPRPYLQTPANEYGGVISPDGQWLAYVSTESGREELYVQSFPSPGSRYHIAQTSFGGGVWNRSGTLLSWMDPDGRPMVADVRPGPEFHVGPPRLLGVLPRDVGSALPSRDFSRYLASVPLSTTARTSVTIVTDWVNALPKKN